MAQACILPPPQQITAMPLILPLDKYPTALIAYPVYLIPVDWIYAPLITIGPPDQFTPQLLQCRPPRTNISTGTTELVPSKEAKVAQDLAVSRCLIYQFHEGMDGLTNEVRYRYTRQNGPKRDEYFAIRQRIENFFRNPDSTINSESVDIAFRRIRPASTVTVAKTTCEEEPWGILLALRWEQRLTELIKNSPNPFLNSLRIDQLWRLGIDRSSITTSDQSPASDARYIFEDEIGYLGGYYRSWYTALRWLEEGGREPTISDYDDLHTAAVCALRQTRRGGSFFRISFREENEGVGFPINQQPPFANTSPDGLEALKKKVAANPEWWDQYTYLDDDYPNERKICCAALPTETLVSQLEITLATGYKKLAQSATQDEKIAAIAELVQELEQRHFFNDGNCRTNVIFMNYLLIREGFLPSVLSDPNIIDAFSIPELVQAIEEGQWHVLTYLQN